jgi:Fe2+ or Zn2+ uptake regulation protein
LVCQQCNTALEVCSHGLHGHFTETARDNGYLFRKAVLEIHGVCPNCQERARTAE